MVRSKNNTTKRDQDVVHHHPYNTRSSRKHQKKNSIQPKDTTRRSRINHAKNPHQPKDNTSSVPGSSNTIKGKPSAGGRVQKIPFALYCSIKLAIEARKVWEARRDQRSELDLQRAERRVTSFEYYYTHDDPVLPPNWKFNPDTASTLKPIDTIPPLRLVKEPEKKMKPKGLEDVDDDSDSESSDPGPDVPSIVVHKLMNVPLKEDDIDSWMQFKKLDEDYPTSVPGLQHHEIKFPVNIEHPFVSVVGYFAVNCFNEVFEELIEKGEHNQLHDPTFTECTYFKSDNFYWISITILADEYGFRGIYKARVKCTIDNGNRTLQDFVLADIKCGKKGRPSKSKSSKDVHLPDSSGMWLRSSRRASPITYGYDYHNPTDFVCF